MDCRDSCDLREGIKIKKQDVHSSMLIPLDISIFLRRELVLPRKKLLRSLVLSFCFPTVLGGEGNDDTGSRFVPSKGEWSLFS